MLENYNNCRPAQGMEH